MTPTDARRAEGLDIKSHEEVMSEAWERWRDHCYEAAEGDIRAALKMAFTQGYINGTRDMLGAMSDWRDSKAAHGEMTE